MMGLLVKLLLRATDLVEAEGRVARRAVGDLAVSLLLFATTAAVALLAMSVLAAAMLAALVEVMPWSAALACVGAALALVAVVVASIARRYAPRTHR